MPQMAPMNWMILFIYFLLIMFFFMNMFYFFFYKSHKKMFLKYKKPLNYNKFI